MNPEEFLPLPHLPFHVLLALSEQPALHGWGVIKRIEAMTGGSTCPSSGSLYLAMNRLEERGLIETVKAPKEETDPRRRYYALSPLGRRVLSAESGRLASLVALARASGAMDED